MKIIYTHDIFAFQRFGGISRYIVEIMKRIPPEVAEAKIFAGFHINEYLGGLQGVTGVKVPIFKGRGRVPLVLNALMYLGRRKVNDLAQRTFIHTGRDTVVHLSYYSSSMVRGGGKVVVTAYDMIHELFPQYFPMDKATRTLKEASFKRADRIIAISECTKRDLIRLFGVDPEKVTVIYLGNSLGHIAADEQAHTIGIPYILYVGDRTGYKNFEGLTEAYARSPLLRDSFALVNFGGGAFTPWEKKRLMDMGISGLVHHVAGDDALLAAYYRNARAFIHPSLYEGFGLPLLEAMGFDCPVICANAGSLPEVAGDAGVYFDPENIEEIQHVLETSLFDDTLLREQIKRGKKRVTEFNWDRAARETMDLYRSLVG